jgi:hypothetical protein
MPGDYWEAVDRLEAMRIEHERMKDQPPKPDRFAFLKAARDACLIEIVVGVAIFAGAFVALTHQGVIQWP